MVASERILMRNADRSVAEPRIAAINHEAALAPVAGLSAEAR